MNELEKIIEIAASWWVDQIYFSIIDFDMEENSKELTSNGIFSNMISKSNNDKIKKFKTILGNKIRVELLARPFSAFNVNHHILNKVLKESQLNVFFSSIISMSITRDTVSIKTGNSKIDMIYSNNLANSSLKK